MKDSIFGFEDVSKVLFIFDFQTYSMKIYYTTDRGDVVITLYVCFKVEMAIPIFLKNYDSIPEES